MEHLQTMPRPIELDKLSKIVALASAGDSRESIVSQVGIDRSTVQRWVSRMASEGNVRTHYSNGQPD